MTYDEAYPKEGGGLIRQLNDTRGKNTPPLLEINPETKAERLSALGNEVFHRLREYTVYEASKRIAQFHMRERGFKRCLPELLLKYLPEKEPAAETQKDAAGSSKHLKLSGLYKNGEVVMYDGSHARVFLHVPPNGMDIVRSFVYEERAQAHVFLDFPIEDADMMAKLSSLPDTENSEEILAAWARMREKKEIIAPGTAIARMFKRGGRHAADPGERKRLRRQRAKESIEEDRLRKGKLSKATEPTVPIVSQAEPAEASVAADTEGSPFSGEEDW